MTHAVLGYVGGWEDSILTFDKFEEEKAKDRDFKANKVDLDAFHQLSCVNGILGGLTAIADTPVRALTCDDGILEGAVQL